jgi:predicted RNA-binding Zn-ribbon protein involved in translation (DUF1610 family)
MTTLADILNVHGPDYLNRYGDAIPANHRRAIEDISRCRTAHLGQVHWWCDSCKREHFSYQACKNRHCPQCDNHKADAWLQKQLQRRLPVEHFLVTFTLPSQLHSLMRKQQKRMYAIFFKVSAMALKILAADPRFIGGDIAMTGVLHTWGRQLQYHPHIHYLIPGIAVDNSSSRLIYAKKNFLIHNKPLAVLVKKLFRSQCIKQGLHNLIPPCAWEKDWVVNCKSVGDGSAALKYLVPYLFRVAISNNNILHCNDGKVTFRYRPTGSSVYQTMTLGVFEFIRRFLQHVLPKGFRKVRYFGFLHPKNKRLLVRIKLLLTPAYMPPPIADKKSAGFRCPDCGKPMIPRNISIQKRAPPAGKSSGLTVNI